VDIEPSFLREVFLFNVGWFKLVWIYFQRLSWQKLSILWGDPVGKVCSVANIKWRLRFLPKELLYEESESKCL